MWRRTTTVAALALLGCVPAAWADGGGAGYPSASGGTAPGQVIPPPKQAPQPQPQPHQLTPSLPPPTATPGLSNRRALPPAGTPRVGRHLLLAGYPLVRQ